MKLGKIFIIVLALHVVVILGILGYHSLKSKNKAATGEMATRDLIESAPNSINNKTIADMDSAAAPTEESYATEIISADTVVTPEAATIPVVEAPQSAQVKSAPAPVVAPVTAPITSQKAAEQTVFAPAAQAAPVAVVPESNVAAAPAPESKAAEASYKVQKGDTLIKIAKANGIKVSELKSANQLSGDNLKIGQALVIPGKQTDSNSPVAAAPVDSVAPGVEPVPAIKEPQAAQNSQHTVKQGETLYRISKTHKVSVDAIKSANNMKSETLKVGQKLIIPGATKTIARVPSTTHATADASEPSAKTVNTYVVKKGDSIYGIAKKHNVSVNEIITANNIKDVSKIGIGQKLSIPVKGNVSATPKSPSPESAEQGTVKEVKAVTGAVATAAAPVVQKIEMANNDKLD